MKRLGLGALCLGAIGLLQFSDSGSVGFSVTQGNGAKVVWAGSSPAALLAALILLYAYLLALTSAPLADAGSDASGTRRAIAWFLDLFLSVFALSSILAVPFLLREALLTGHFHWAFERATTSAGDWALSLSLIAAEFAGIGLYWTFPVIRGGQTIGQALVAVTVVGRDATRPRFGRCFLRGLLQPFAVIPWLTHFFTSSGTYFHDDIARVSVVRTRPVPRRAA